MRFLPINMDFLQYSAQDVEHFGAANCATNKRRKSNNNNNNYSANGEDFAVPVRQRSQANARERDRTHSVNTAFSTLRTLIPTEPKDRKLSKIETLRLASSYISHLGTQLMAGPIDQPCLRLSTTLLDEEVANSANRHQVCTFCIAHKKSPKKLLVDSYECHNYENQIFLNGASSSLATSILAKNDVNIYYS